MTDDDEKTSSLYLKFFMVFVASTSTSTGLQYFTPALRADGITRTEVEHLITAKENRVLNECNFLEKKLNNLEREVLENHKEISKVQKDFNQLPPQEWRDRIRYIEQYLFQRKGTSKAG